MTARSRRPIKGKVLAVDDCATMLLLLQSELEASGFSVQAVDSGDSALQVAADGDFDAVVLDIEMPGVDGMTVGRALRLDPRTARTLIALHTSLREADVRAGFDQYDTFVAKPSGLAGLGERLDLLLQRRRLAGGVAPADESTSRGAMLG